MHKLGRGIWEISVSPSQFCCKPKTALRKVFKKKKKKEAVEFRGLSALRAVRKTVWLTIVFSVSNRTSKFWHIVLKIHLLKA